MGTSNVDSPRKILDLGSGIASAAALVGPGLVAFLTTRPARIAIEGGSQASGDPIDLPRLTAQDVALLSKEFVLVREKDGTIWLVPTGDPLRVREVMRDMRALIARPSGEGALAISDDGRVFTLSLGRGEVGARPTEVAGRIRAGDASEGTTCFIAEGEEGGQLRFFPGAALERPTAKVTLPKEAAEFDNVRAGRALAVAFKRSGSSLCVATRDGSNAQVKMVEIEGSIADVAVTDSSVVVALSEGHVAVFDAAALVAAEGRATADGRVAVSSKGRPRVVVAMTRKGTTSIWVGTTSGEVLSASLVEAAPAAKVAKEEPVVVALAAPQAGEIEALRKELDEARAALVGKDKELEEARASLAEKTSETATLAAELERSKVLLTTADARAETAETRAQESETRARELEATQEARLREAEAERAKATFELEGKHQAAVKDRDAARAELGRLREELEHMREYYNNSRAKRIERLLPERMRVILDALVSILDKQKS